MVNSKLRMGLAVRLALTLLCVTFIVLGVNDLLVYWEIRSRMEQELGETLSVVAVSLGTQIDGSLVYSLDPGDVESRTYKNIQARLERFLSRTFLRNVYVVDRKGRCLVDAAGDVPPGMTRPQFTYDSVEFDTVFKGNPASSVLFRGKDGQYYKSGYAPVFFAGEVVAAVGVDAGASFLDSVAELQRFMWGLGSICLALAVITGLVFAEHMIRPLRKLVNSARNIGRGDMGSPITMQRMDEIGILGNTMEEMRKDILTRDEQLKTMLASVAHEIRNPLAGIELFAEIIRNGLQADDERLDQAERIIKEVRTLKQTINDFLDYARPEKPEPQSVPVRETLHELHPFLQKDIAAKGIMVKLPEDVDNLRVVCDPRHLTEIFMNLLKNATAAVPEGGRIDITSQARNGVVEMAVHDNGPGIPPELHERVFMPFFTTRSEGTGLGLAIARKLAETNGGGLHYQNGAGTGAHFILTLPGDNQS